ALTGGKGAPLGPRARECTALAERRAERFRLTGHRGWEAPAGRCRAARPARSRSARTASAVALGERVEVDGVERVADERAAAHLAVPVRLEALHLGVEAREVLVAERDADHLVVIGLERLGAPAALGRRRLAVEGLAQDLAHLVGVE